MLLLPAFRKTWNTLPSYDITYCEDLAAVVNEEPVQPKDLAMMGMLSSIGIVKGKPFAPDAATSKALEDGLKLA